MNHMPAADVLDTDVYPDDISHVEAALEAAFGLGYTLAGLAAVIFAILLDASAAATLFCSGLDTGSGAPLYSRSEVPPGSAGPGTGDVYKARLASEAAAAYAARGLLPHVSASHHGSGMDPRFSSGEVVERDGDGTRIAPDGVSRVRNAAAARQRRQYHTAAALRLQEMMERDVFFIPVRRSSNTLPVVKGGRVYVLYVQVGETVSHVLR